MSSAPYLVLPASAEDQMVVVEAPSAGQADELALPVDGHHLGRNHTNVVVEGQLVKVSAAIGVAMLEERVMGNDLRGTSD